VRLLDACLKAGCFPSVIHQVVVHVGDQHQKRDPPPEFFDIRLWLRALLAKGIDDFSIDARGGASAAAMPGPAKVRP